MSASGASGSTSRGGSNGSSGRGGGGGGRGDGGKGKGRAGGIAGRGRGGGGGSSSRVRRAADYTPAQEPRMDQAAIAEASRVAIEKAQRERDQEVAAAGLDADGEVEEPDSCYICAEPVRYYALGTCSHRTCHVCSLRLRALYKKKECTFCKTDLPSVITTIDPTTTFQDFPPDAFPYSDARLAIAFETSEMMEDTLTLLRFNCPQLDCDYLATGWPDLKKHVRSAHGLVFCDLCTKHKKIFTHEHTLYTPQQLQIHTKEGDGAPTGSDDDDERTGFTGHPMCEFCRIVFYDNDQLFAHCRDKHEQCFICIRNGTGRYQYYIDYPHLETHFQANHHLCLNPKCLEERFVVFDTEIDLQAHQVSQHNETVGKTSRRLETNFTYAQTRDPRAGGGVAMGPGRPTGQSTMPNIAATASSSAPIREEAPQASTSFSTAPGRNRVIPGLQRGGFNTSLSDAAPPSRKAEKKPAQNGAMGDSVTGIKQNDPLMAARHSSVLTRFSEAVQGNESKVAAYRAAIRSFRASESTAGDAIGTIHSLLDNQLDITGRIIISTADLLDSAEKRGALLQAWDSYSHAATSSVDAFPSLVSTSASTSSGVGRPQPPSSQRSVVPKSAKQNNSALWARVEQAAANKNVGAIPGLTRAAQKEKFPALPSSSQAVSKTAGARGLTPWASTRQQATSPGSTYFPVASAASAALIPSPARSPALGRPAPKPASGGADFPGLPSMPQAQVRAAQKAALFNRSGNSTPSTWGPTSPPAADDLQQAIQRSLADMQVGNGTGTNSGPPEANGNGASSSKKKKGKQLLFQYGL